MTDTQSHSQDRELIPRTLLRAMGLLVCAVLAIVTYARIADVPLSATPPAAEITHERAMILISDGVSGAVSVLSPEGAVIARLDATQGGFVAGVARVIDRNRAQADLPAHTPVIVTRRANGRLDITDPATGWSADLMGFGADNASRFARLLDQP
ncbi:pullulanase [Ruegeria sp. HKCCD4884]|uniref:photosynthetic complex assembly protein PuhC n=1 Tax=Ruegeria sp. HKCCD4884 TaxID=2683022 RepID=UPI001492E9A0|nr:photosynthetic complex assembly protein PuhC [Ruegeria sp. HKCCD4884]NOD91942.1 pullulanase [Ruegeria sp. HKCCD4884]